MVERIARIDRRAYAAGRAGAGRAATAAPTAHRTVPLAPAEEPWWLAHRWSDRAGAVHVVARTALDTPVEPARLDVALRAVAAEHDLWRHRWADGAEGPIRWSEPNAVPAGPAVLTDPTETESAELVERRFELATDCPVRVALLRRTDGPDELLLVGHRIAVDEWTAPALLTAIATAAGQPPADRPDPARTPTDDPADIDPAGTDPADIDPAVPDPAGAGPAGSDPESAGPGASDAAVVDPTPPPAGGTTGLWTGADRTGPATWTAATHDVDLPPTLAATLTARSGDELLAVLAAAWSVLLSRYGGGGRSAVLGTLRRPPADGTSTHATSSIDTSVVATPAVLHLPVTGLSWRALTAHAAAGLARASLDRTGFTDVVRAAAPAREPGRHPLFQTTVALVEAAGAALVTPALGRLDLAVWAFTGGPDGLRVRLAYQPALFAAEQVRAVGGHLLHLLGQAVADPEAAVGSATLLYPEEVRGLVETGRGPVSTGDDRRSRNLVELVDEWSAGTPGATALRFDGRGYTYGELRARSERVAAALTELRIAPEEIVGVLFERGPALPVTMLGILRAGGAYMPLDPDHPVERLGYQIGDARCGLVVTTATLAARLPAGVRTVIVDPADPGGAPPATAPEGRAPEDTAAEGTAPEPGRTPAIDGHRLAYVIYTSGSTGRPKGTLVQHGSAVNYVLHCRDRFPIGPGDRILQFANPCFDVSVFDIFATLANGATLVHAPRAALYDPRELAVVLRTERITAADLPPVIPQLLDLDGFEDLRMLNVGGEEMPGDLAPRWRTPEREVHNIYGPTEVTVTSTEYRFPYPAPPGRPPIGRPLTNLTAYVTDEFGDLTPDGVPGELRMGGDGVVRGYLHRPALTAERFQPDPHGPPGSRVYRTGDLVRWLPDGNLDFLGRVDRQIKLHGNRIEPGEIEVALRLHPDVRNAVVDLYRTPAGDQDLIAYLVVAAGATMGVAELRDFLRDRLPARFLPNRAITVDSLPLTSNGKVDRVALARLASAQGGATVPPSPLNDRLAVLWWRALGRAPADSPGAQDFFDAGGTSIGALALCQAVRDSFGTRITMDAFLADPTFAAVVTAVLRGLRDRGSGGRTG
ncbi:non-ribosomal peptide synthetase [Micromonospora yangpuensis]|uniref:Amino acid adenylation domain-containing protein n=1 Tax=Micromonospora yangpuensis TaxID=683228 RepID=A0A1C6VGS4_9ACTN|nr:amino acid adenylation domain-containing protein [Micromonospora yangpuensis]GGL99189.1 hypothetical protein GCM10012279_15750 [Micromonospora yangpuensis]SCL65529.1 amino acid adenylation domain-containing protein [Micromonospora yangpuensis]